MNILLINPPRQYFTGSPRFKMDFPIGLLYIASAIRDICRVQILDCLITEATVTRYPKRIVYGTPVDVIAEHIRSFIPDVIGITVPFSTQFNIALSMINLCKNTSPLARIVIGGPDVSVRSDTYLQSSTVDFCIIGEGEKAFRELIVSLDSGKDYTTIPGLSFNKNGRVIHNPSKQIEAMDELPLPAYDLIDIRKYHDSKYLYRSRSDLNRKAMSIITSRGCPFDCVFCSIHLHMGKKYRCHSPSHIVRHMEYLYTTYGIKHFHFEDDNLTLIRSRFNALLDLFIDRNLPFAWDTPNGVRFDTLDLKLITKMKKAGCHRLSIGIESGNPAILNHIIRKNIDFSRILPTINMCRSVNIKVSAFYVIGFPKETLNDMKETIDFAIRLFRDYQVDPCLLIATPLYGTDLYKECVEHGYINPWIEDRQLGIATQPTGMPLITTDLFGPIDIINLCAYYRDKLNEIRAMDDDLFIRK